MKKTMTRDVESTVGIGRLLVTFELGQRWCTSGRRPGWATTRTPPARIEVAYHKTDVAIQHLVDLLAA